MKKSLIFLFISVAAMAFVACASKSNEAGTVSATQTQVQTADTRTETVMQDEAITATRSPKGLVLTVGGQGESMEVTEVSGTVRGTYAIELMHDGMAVLRTERLKAREHGAASVEAAIMDAEKERGVSELVIKENSSFANISYPLFEAEYLTGQNEDTRVNHDIYIQTDGFDFRVHTSVPADAAEDYSEIITTWLLNIELVENEAEG